MLEKLLVSVCAFCCNTFVPRGFEAGYLMILITNNVILMCFYEKGIIHIEFVEMDFAFQSTGVYSFELRAFVDCVLWSTVL